MSHDWTTCEGPGQRCILDDGLDIRPSRRGLLAGLSLGLFGWAAGSALAQVSLAPRSKPDRVLVVVFLRGGADGLSLLVPYTEDEYYRERPNLAVPAKQVVRLDGRFGLHPALAPLADLYHAGTMVPLHAVGSNDETRSHFEAMDTMERGVAGRGGPGNGWVARYLAATDHGTDSPLRAVSFGSVMPASLAGGPGAVSMENLEEYRLAAPATVRTSLAALYADGKDAASHAGRATLDVLKTLDRLNVDTYKAQATYPESPLGRGLKQTACLLRANVGMEVACLDKGGWDTHVAQGVYGLGLLPGLLDDLGKSLAAFARDLGPDFERVNLVVMTEFGRRIAENTGLGTDHGHGSCMFVMGGGLQGKRVVANWPGLRAAVGPGDLEATTDYRQVLAEVLGRFRPAENEHVFPGLKAHPVGVVA